MPLEENFKSFQAVDEAFRVVQPVNAENHLVLRLDDLLGRLGQLDESIEGNSDRQRTDTNGTSTMLNQKILPVHATAQVALAAVDEVQAVVADVKSDHVAGEHALKYLVGPRKQAEDVPGWERDVQEESQLEREVLLLGQLADVIRAQHEMIVVHPDDRNARVGRVARALLQRLDGAFGEQLVHRHISPPVLGQEDCAA